MSKIYVMGPYSAPTSAERQYNTTIAMQIGVALIKKGHDPFIPHLTHYLDEYAKSMGVELPNEFWCRYDFHWMPLCDAGYFIGPSAGANRERFLMRTLGRPVYTTLDQVPGITNPVHVTASIDVTEMQKALQACIDALEYVDTAHPDQVTGSAVRYPLIKRIKVLLGQLP